MSDINFLIFTELCVGFTPPAGIIDSLPSAIIPFGKKGDDFLMVQLKGDIGRPVIVIAGSLGAYLKGKLNLGDLVLKQGVVGKLVFQKAPGKPQQGSICAIRGIKAIGAVFIIKIGNSGGNAAWWRNFAVAVVPDWHIDKDRRLPCDFVHMGKYIQGNIGRLNAAQLL